MLLSPSAKTLPAKAWRRLAATVTCYYKKIWHEESNSEASATPRIDRKFGLESPLRVVNDSYQRSKSVPSLTGKKGRMKGEMKCSSGAPWIKPARKGLIGHEIDCVVVSRTCISNSTLLLSRHVRTIIAPSSRSFIPTMTFSNSTRSRSHVRSTVMSKPVVGDNAVFTNKLTHLVDPGISFKTLSHSHCEMFVLLFPIERVVSFLRISFVAYGSFSHVLM